MAFIIWATNEPTTASMSLRPKTWRRDPSSPSSSESCTARWGTAGRGRRRPVSRFLCGNYSVAWQTWLGNFWTNLWLTRRYSSAQPLSNIHRFRPFAIHSSPSFWLRLSTYRMNNSLITWLNEVNWVVWLILQMNFYFLVDVFICSICLNFIIHALRNTCRA